MTEDEAVEMLAAAIERDGDATAERAMTALRQRAEQAEREREEALRMWREYKAEKDADVARYRDQREEDAQTVTDSVDARMRAEADNAALLAELEAFSIRLAKLSAAATPLRPEFRETMEQLAGDVQRMNLQVRGVTGTRRHPGAALLEGMRQTQEEELDALRAAVNAAPSGTERIHAALVAAGVPEEGEVSGVLGLEEHVGRALERMRALEALADAVRSYIDPDNKTPDLFPVRVALKAVDALKVAP